MTKTSRLLLGAWLLGASVLPAAAMEADAGSETPAPSVADAPADPTPADAQDTHWSTTRPPMPFDVMRSVQFLQDQVARGNDRAIRVQALLLRRFGNSFLNADPVVWTDDRNKRAAILFLLSGGTPDVVDQLMRSDRFDEADRPLFEGALAYVRNDLETAAKKLEAIPILDMEPVLAAQLSLVLGQIHQFDKPAEAVHRLDQARLLAPGTLIEEAALRLGAPLVDDAGDHAAADRLARRYFDRYADSSYAANFETRYVAMVVGRAIPDGQAALLAMDGVIGPLSVDRRQRLYLAAARRSLVSGNLGFAKAAAGRAVESGSMQPGDEARGTLYRTAASLGTEDPDTSRAALAAIDRDMLHPEDQKLLDAAFGVLQSMARPALVSEAVLDSSAAADTPSVLARAREALNAASRQIETSKP
ncbi:hypothetical protein [Aureimonas sp. ME7]|uniref:hypothetical protein n=1 Tax=Aureimonas sp. ME7 TaxID=2744252 RepID=UPI0015F602D3|nr:hypothetical protein [Aureimonas sp. ME7]